MLKTVFFILNDYNNFNRLRLNLIKKLSLNYKVIVFLNFNNNSSIISDHSSKNLKFVNLKIDNSINILNFLFLLIKIFIYIVQFKPQIIYSFTIKPNIISVILSYFNNTKFVATFTGLGNLYINYPKIYVCIFKFLLFKKNNNLNFVFHNKSDKKLFNDKFNFKNSFVVNGSGIKKSSRFRKKEIDDNLRVISISRAIKEKGIIEFLKIVNKFYKNNKISFTLISDLNKDDIYKQYDLNFQNKNKNFKVINKNYNFLDHLKKNDLFILLSKREGLSHAMINALNFGLPCITLNVPGNNDLITDNFNGFLIKDDNNIVNNAYSAIMRILDKKKLYRSLSNNALSSIDSSFTEQNILFFYENFL